MFKFNVKISEFFKVLRFSLFKKPSSQFNLQCTFMEDQTDRYIGFVLKDAEYSETKKFVFARISSYFEFFPSKSYVLDHSEFMNMHINSD